MRQMLIFSEISYSHTYTIEYHHILCLDMTITFKINLKAIIKRSHRGSMYWKQLNAKLHNLFTSYISHTMKISRLDAQHAQYTTQDPNICLQYAVLIFAKQKDLKLILSDAASAAAAGALLFNETIALSPTTLIKWTCLDKSPNA